MYRIKTRVNKVTGEKEYKAQKKFLWIYWKIFITTDLYTTIKFIEEQEAWSDWSELKLN